MKKIITIGEFSLHIIFDAQGAPMGTMAGGRVVNSAMIASRSGADVVMVGELSADAVGDMIMKQVEASGANVHSVDRFTEGETPTVLFIGDEAEAIRYENYPESCFDVIWPRIENGDVVVFGGYYALDERMRQRLVQLLNQARSRGAVMVYVPGFEPKRCPRVTRVMPSVLENLELSDLVVMTDRDCAFLFDANSGEKCYRDHVDFYCRSMVNIDTVGGRLEYFSSDQKTAVDIEPRVAASLIGQSGVLAGVAKHIADNAISLDYQTIADERIRHGVLTQAVTIASASHDSLTHDWQKRH